ncbi:Patched domain-containing protein 3 [Lonchura striata]|uniref:Patched domain-containing protein 3 n=1 Tax=Lonchura striata TaxID=40157 RepID=A0A218V6T0_9PASE|nr:Patched domain-containing protein 3 [Lonchura striata domestica]
MAGPRDPAERCSCRNTNCVERPLRRLFEGLASAVAACPWPFVLVPLLLSGVLGAGFVFLPQRQANDIEEQFTPTWGPAKAERDFVRRHFPTDDSERFSAPRLPTEGAYAALIAVATNGTSVLEPAAWAEVLRLNAAVRDADYERLCARTAGGCASPNPLLSRRGDAGPPAPGSLRFPVNGSEFLGAALGGVETDGGRLLGARALKLVTYFTSLSRQEEFEGNTRSVIPLFSITYFLTITFSIISCLRGQMDISYKTLVRAAVGVGVDDMFIMIASWEQSLRKKEKSNVKSLLAETYTEAALSVTITTLTDVLAFFIGTWTAFPSVRSFCLYTGTAFVFCYVYTLTFFGAVLVLNHKREQGNRHWLTCMRVDVGKDQAENSCLYNACCIGSCSGQPSQPEGEHPMSTFLKKYYGPFITNKWIKVLMVLLYGAYLGGSIYGCTQIREGIDLRNLANDASYVIPYYDDEDKYFSTYGPRVMVVIAESVDYWNESVRLGIESCTQNLENIPYVDKNYSESWLRVYTGLAKRGLVNIDIGVAGFMTFWNVNLDSISMINLVICIGFSVDFSAHISYAFVTSGESSANKSPDLAVKKPLTVPGSKLLSSRNIQTDHGFLVIIVVLWNGHWDSQRNDSDIFAFSSS